MEEEGESGVKETQDFDGGKMAENNVTLKSARVGAESGPPQVRLEDIVEAEIRVGAQSGPGDRSIRGTGVVYKYRAKAKKNFDPKRERARIFQARRY